jgi:Ca-activated chloride channel family protein
MRSLLLISLSLLLLSWQTACAQLAPADDFFHRGAQFYISNNIAQAKESVTNGLKLYPDDIKLKKLDELLKQQSQQQSQQNQQSQSQSQQNSEQNQKQQQQQQSKQNQSSQPNDKQPQEQQQQAKSAGKQSNEKRDGQAGQTQALKAQEMSPEQAQRLLDAQKGDEQFLQLTPKNPPESPNKPAKDW